MSVKDLMKSGNANEQDTSDVQQSKSLIANVYSTEHDDNYKDVTSWDWFDSLAYNVTKDGGLVRTSLKQLAPSGSHEEWYCRLQVNLAHYIGEILGYEELPDGSEPEGPVPLMEFIGFDSNDIARYIVSDGNDVTVSDLQDALKEVRSQNDSDEEQDSE